MSLGNLWIMRSASFLKAVGNCFRTLDGKWYTQIATLGYSYADEGQQHSVAFYPLFPLLIRGLITLGIQVEVAGVLIIFFAFLGALVIVYFWLEQRYYISQAA